MPKTYQFTRDEIKAVFRTWWVQTDKPKDRDLDSLAEESTQLFFDAYGYLTSTGVENK